MIRSKKMMLVALLGAAALTVPTLSLAQQPDDRGGYLGLTAGIASYKDTCSRVTVSCDDSDTAWRFSGGYQFNRNLGVELAYANLGAASASGAAGASARYEVFAWDLVGVGFIPMTPQFSFLAKFGLYRAEVDTRGNTGTFSGSQSDKNSGLTFGFGAQYMLGRSLGLRAEWQRYGDVGGPATGEDDINVLSAGVLWKF